MERVDSRWYKVFHWAATAVAGLIAAMYPVFSHWLPTAVDVSGASLLSSIIGGAVIGYGVLVWPALQKWRLWFASLITLIGLTALVSVIIYYTGALGSVYVLVWFALIVIAGIFGGYILASYCFLSTIYFALLSIDILSPGNPNLIRNLLELGLSYVAALLGFVFWRRYYVLHKPSSGPNPYNNQIGKALQGEQLKTEFLINSITDGVVVFDNAGNIQLINPAGAELIGWRVHEMTGLDYRSVFRFFSRLGRDVVELREATHPFAQVLTTGEPMVNSDAILATRSLEKQLIVSLSVSPLYTTPNEYNGAVAIFRDVSREKAQERQRSEFISTASHEMRTPVAAIEGYISLALNEKVCTIDPKARDFLNKAHETTQHLGELFRDLLAIAKSEDGRLENHPSVIELGPFIERLIEDVRFVAEKKGLKIEFLVATQTYAQGSTLRPLYYIYADTERLREVMTNLLNNAIKFTTSGTIIVGLHGEESYVQLSVKDSGIGIPAEDIPHLFQKFYRVDSTATRTIGGTGLGLYLCRKIVELYKGQIWVESEFGKGSTFFINLPRLSTEQATELLRTSNQPQTPLPTTPTSS
jgi:PAS domain S-box-containing protein